MLAERSKLLAELFPSGAPMEVSKASLEEVRRQDRENAEAAKRRVAEIWAQILPTTNRIMPLVLSLPVEFRLWALAQVAGDTVAHMSETVDDAFIRADYLGGCVVDKTMDTMAERLSGGFRR